MWLLCLSSSPACGGQEVDWEEPGQGGAGTASGAGRLPREHHLLRKQGPPHKPSFLSHTDYSASTSSHTVKGSASASILIQLNLYGAGCQRPGEQDTASKYLDQ